MAQATNKVYAALAAVRNEINAIGIVKDGEATDGIRFKFRGIDSVLNAFSGPMLRAGLMLIPTYSDPVIDVRATSGGKPNFNCRVRGSFKAISTEDGSELQLGDFFGEANDTQDKAFAKAQSIALRQAYLQTFVVPLGADYDPENGDSSGDPVEPAPAPQKPAKPQSRNNKPAAEGAVVSELTEPQQRILKQRMDAAGKTGAQVAEKFGAVDTGNFNSVIDWLRGK